MIAKQDFLHEAVTKVLAVLAHSGSIQSSILAEQALLGKSCNCVIVEQARSDLYLSWAKT